MMNDWGWMGGAMGLGGLWMLALLALVVLAILAPVKYLGKP